MRNDCNLQQISQINKGKNERKISKNLSRRGEKNSEADSKEEKWKKRERRILNCLHTRACLYSEFQTEKF